MIIYEFLVVGLIRWGIVIHRFIDGYSRLITALRASDNNRGDTVLDLFMSAAAVFAIPSRLRGDHGVENILVAAYMEEQNGHSRGSYIWGRYVHLLFICSFLASLTMINIFTGVFIMFGSSVSGLMSPCQLGQHGKTTSSDWSYTMVLISTILFISGSYILSSSQQ